MNFDDFVLWGFNEIYQGISETFFELEFTLCKAEQPLRGMKSQEKQAQKY